MNVLERLENRRLLSDVALDLTFGDAGSAPEGGSLLVAPLADGKILTVTDHSAARLNADGSVDPTFQLPGGALDGVFLSEVFVVKNATRLFTTPGSKQTRAAAKTRSRNCFRASRMRGSR